MQTLSGEKQGSWTASQSLAKGVPEGWMKDGEQHSSTGFVTAASTAPYAFFLPVTLLLSPHANNCLSLCWVTRKWISPLLDIKKPVYCPGSVFCGTQWSRRHSQWRLALGDWHRGVDREAKCHLQMFPRLPKMCFHHTVSRLYSSAEIFPDILSCLMFPFWPQGLLTMSDFCGSKRLWYLHLQWS